MTLGSTQSYPFLSGTTLTLYAATPVIACELSNKFSEEAARMVGTPSIPFLLDTIMNNPYSAYALDTMRLMLCLIG